MTNKTELYIEKTDTVFDGIKVLLWNFDIKTEDSILTYEYEIDRIPADVPYTIYSLENIEDSYTIEFQKIIGNIILDALEKNILKRE